MRRKERKSNKCDERYDKKEINGDKESVKCV